MVASNSTAPDMVAGLTSRTFHICLWILLVAGCLGNVIVLLWRCRRKECSTLSLLIASLAFADILWSIHSLLLEVPLVYPVFYSATGNVTVSFSKTDRLLCLGSTFLAYMSCNAVMMTVLAIALVSFLTFRGCRHSNRFIAIFILLSWTTCLTVGASAAWNVTHDVFNRSDLDLVTFSAAVMYGCGIASDCDVSIDYTVFVITINAVSSILCGVVYICMWWRIRKSGFNLDHSLPSMSQELRHLQIRLVIIVFLNLICWWPVCVLYWFAYIRKNILSSGTIPPALTEVAFFLAAAVSSINPIIYTMASSHFCLLRRHVCICNVRHEERRPLLANAGEIGQQPVEESCWKAVVAACICQFCCCQETSDKNDPDWRSDETDDASLFPETVDHRERFAVSLSDNTDDTLTNC